MRISICTYLPVPISPYQCLYVVHVHLPLPVHIRSPCMYRYMYVFTSACLPSPVPICSPRAYMYMYVSTSDYLPSPVPICSPRAYVYMYASTSACPPSPVPTCRLRMGLAGAGVFYGAVIISQKLPCRKASHNFPPHKDSDSSRLRKSPLPQSSTTCRDMATMALITVSTLIYIYI